MKHAYLVMAHHQVELLQVLLELLDDEENDIYLHVDEKLNNFNSSSCKDVIHKSELHFIKRRSVTWGGDSQIQLEVDLLREATKTPHSFYHLISGVDLPLKSQNYIHHFFKNHQDYEFISFDYDQNSKNFSNRVDQFYLFQELHGGKKDLLYYLDSLSVALQKDLGIHRICDFSLELKKGANWFSISHELALFILDNIELIHNHFRSSRCADELFLQTIVYNSHFRNRLYFDNQENRYYNMRYVDFKRGNPYIFCSRDFNELTGRKELFARKFDWNKDKGVVLQLKDYILRD